jgi:hypothetical protein
MAPYPHASSKTANNVTSLDDFYRDGPTAQRRAPSILDLPMRAHDKTLIVIAPPGAGKTTFLHGLVFSRSRPAFVADSAAQMKIVPTEGTLKSVSCAGSKMAGGEFPDATQIQNILHFTVVGANSTSAGPSAPYSLRAVDTLGGSFHGLPDQENEEANRLFNELVAARGVVFLVDVKNFGEGARAFERVVDLVLLRLHARQVDTATADSRAPSKVIDMGCSLVISKCDQLVEDRGGVLRFKRRALDRSHGDAGKDADLVDLPPEVDLDLHPKNVRTYLHEHCGAAGRRLVETLDGAFARPGYFALSAVGFLDVEKHKVPTVRTEDGRQVVRSAADMKPFGLFEPIAYLVDPTESIRARPDETAPFVEPVSERKPVAPPLPPPPLLPPAHAVPRPRESLFVRLAERWSPATVASMILATSVTLACAIILIAVLLGARQ